MIEKLTINQIENQTTEGQKTNNTSRPYEYQGNMAPKGLREQSAFTNYGWNCHCTFYNHPGRTHCYRCGKMKQGSDTSHNNYRDRNQHDERQGPVIRPNFFQGRRGWETQNSMGTRIK